MITRVYFLAATQPNNVGGLCESFRTMVYKSWFSPDISKVVNDFFNEISEANDLPSRGWSLKTLSKVR